MKDQPRRTPDNQERDQRLETELAHAHTEEEKLERELEHVRQEEEKIEGELEKEHHHNHPKKPFFLVFSLSRKTVPNGTIYMKDSVGVGGHTDEAILFPGSGAVWFSTGQADANCPA
jgi:hypothetical protein